jgi:uncharacterized protein (TIGR03437 family)
VQSSGTASRQAWSATTDALPTELGGVRVVVLDASGTRRNAGLFFVSPAQINFQIPQGTTAGTAFVYVQRGGTSVGQGVVTIATVAPALFAANTSGQGVAAAIVVRVSPSGAQMTEPAVQINSLNGEFEAVPIDLGPSSDTVYLVPFGVGFRNRSSLTAVTADDWRDFRCGDVRRISRYIHRARPGQHPDSTFTCGPRRCGCRAHRGQQDIQHCEGQHQVVFWSAATCRR